MVDSNIHPGSNTTRSGVGSSDPLKSLGEQAMSAGRDIKDKAAELADASSEKLKDQVAGALDAAKGAASQATEKLKETVSERKSAGADYVGSLAETIRRASKEFDGDLPIAGTYMRKAASQVESISDSIRTGQLNDVVRNAQDFARRQPTAFLGLAAFAGFAVVRFLKTSSQEPDAGTGRPSSPSAPEARYNNEFAK